MKYNHFLVLVAFIASFEVLVVKIYRRRLISLRYAVGWMLVGIVGALVCVFATVFNEVPKLIGVSSLALLGSIGIAGVLLISVQLSISISGIHAKIEKLAEAIALEQTQTSE